MKTGRPTKLTPELQKAFCDQLASGCTYETAAEALEIHHSTISFWLSRGRQEQTGRYANFFKAVQRARAQVVQRLLARAQQRVRSKKDGGEGADPLPLLAVIDRRYQPQVRVQVVSEINEILDKLEQEFAREPEIFERFLSVLAGEQTGPGAVAGASSGAGDEDDDGDPPVVAGTPV